MTRSQFFLIVAVLLSAALLVRTQHESRRLFSATEQAHAQARHLQMEHEQLQLQRRTEAAPARVEKIARQQLHMYAPTPAVTQYASAAGDAQATPKEARREP